MEKIIVIASGKGGVGKTTTAINLGAAINYFGEEVLIIDGNLSTPNIGIHLNSPEVPIDLNKVLHGKADAEEAVYEHQSGFKVMPASLSMNELKKMQPEKFKDFKKDFKKLSNYVIIDCAAGLGHEASCVMDSADEIIIVSNPEIAAITDALKAVKLAQEKKKKVLGVIMTRVRKNNIEMTPDEVKEMLEVPILGMVPEDLSVQESLRLRDAVVHTHPKSKSARAYKEIAAQIIGARYDSNKDKEAMILRVLSALGLRS